MNQRMDTVDTFNFAGAAFQNSRGTSQSFQPISSATSTGQVVSNPQTDPPSGAVAWLRSEASRAYEGQWVALNDDGLVVASAGSPGEMSLDITRAPGITVLYVIPAGVRIAG